MSQPQKFCFVKDDDSHLYLIPLDLKSKFDELCSLAYETDEFDDFESLFKKYMKGTGLSNFSFENPEEIE
jgi:hypothetical protein